MNYKFCKYCRVLSRIWQPAEFCSSQNECGRLFFSLNYFVSELTWFVQVRCDILYAYKSPFFWKLIKGLNLTPRPQISNSLNWIFGTIWFYIFFSGVDPTRGSHLCSSLSTPVMLLCVLLKTLSWHFLFIFLKDSG